MLRSVLRTVGVLLSMLVPTTVFAQGGTTGSIVGYVFDQAGAPLKGIKVVATSPTQIGGAKTAYSNDEGFFRFAALEPGTFEVKASAPKMRPVIQRDIRVGITASAEINLVMEVETAVEEVTVIEKAPLISTTKSNIKETFDLELIEEIPHESRDNIHQQMVNSIAGATGGRVRGGAANQTRFTQDGFDMRGQYPTLKSSSALEIQSGGYGADAPTASGGAINLVTKSGSNKYEFEFQATADSSYLRFFKDEIDSKARSYFFVINPTLAGPIIKDRLWFSFNTESHIIHEPRDPDPTGYFPERPPFRKFIQKGTLKLTWQVTPRNKLQSLTNFDFPMEWDRRGGNEIDPEAQEDRKAQRYFQGLIWEALLTDNLMLRSQAGYIQIPEHIYPKLCTDAPVECDHVPGIVQTYPRRQEYNNTTGNHQRNDLYSVQFQNRLEYFLNTKSLGDHSITLKQEFYTEQDRRGSSKPGDKITEWNGTLPSQETYYYSNDPRLEPARYGWVFNSVTYSRNVSTISDAWRATRYLTLTPALSHIWSTASNSRGDQVVGTTTWAPSISAAWDATRDGRTVIRGSYNIYVDVDTAGLARHTLGGTVNQRCKWNTSTNAFDRECEYSGGASKNTFGLPCGPTGFDIYGNSCREKLTIPRTFEYTAGGEREIVQGIAVGLDFVYRTFENQYEQRETNRIWNNAGSALERSGRYRNGRNETINDLGTPDYARRIYKGATLGVTKREGRLKSRISYTLSDLTGNHYDGTGNPLGDIPPRDVYLWGNLPNDHRHEIKAVASYQWTKWLTTGIRYEYLSGFPYNRLFRNDVTGSFSDYRSRIGYSAGTNINDPADDRELRLPDRQSFNAQFRLNWQPLIGQRLDTAVDVLNLLALRTVTGVGQEDGRDFAQPSGSRFGPFRIRLTLNYRY